MRVLFRVMCAICNTRWLAPWEVRVPVDTSKIPCPKCEANSTLLLPAEQDDPSTDADWWKRES